MWVGLSALIGIGAAGAAHAWGVSAMRVTTGSMDPALSPGDWFASTALDEVGRRTAGRDTIVLFRYPSGTTGRAVKRVVAVGGDRVTISASTVRINGRAIQAPALEGGPAAPLGRTYTVPSGHVFLLGDNSAGSYDSRSFGPVPVTELVGRVRLVVPSSWPVVVTAVAILLFVALAIATGLRGSEAGPNLHRIPRSPCPRKESNLQPSD